MKWKFGDVFQLSFENIKPFQTKKPKPKNKKPFVFSSKGIPLIILIPTPASDHLLGGHNELKTTSVE